jgi:hypothetical protein
MSVSSGHLGPNFDVFPAAAGLAQRALVLEAKVMHEAAGLGPVAQHMHLDASARVGVLGVERVPDDCARCAHEFSPRFIGRRNESARSWARSHMVATHGLTN